MTERSKPPRIVAETHETTPAETGQPNPLGRPPGYVCVMLDDAATAGPEPLTVYIKGVRHHLRPATAWLLHDMLEEALAKWAEQRGDLDDIDNPLLYDDDDDD